MFHIVCVIVNKLAKIPGWISMKLCGGMGNGPRKNPFNFDAEQDKDLDPGFLV